MFTNPNSRGVDLTTLALTAVASGLAAYACSKVWAPGTLPSAAVTPVLVAVIKEALTRPAEVVSQAVPVRGVVRSAGGGSDEPARRRPPPDERPTRVAEPPISYTTRRSAISPRWRLAIVTGVLGFVLCVLVLTVPEIVAGGSASGGGRQTTLFGGEKKQRERTETTTTPTRTVTPPQRTVTVPPPTKTVPAPTTTAPPPAGRTPAPKPTPPVQPAPVQP